ncbi:MAG: 50S ribosomal protein L25 [Anaerolineales bacterium]
MSELILNAEHREVTGKKVKVLRRQGYLPAVLYGVGIESIPIKLDLKEASKVISAAGSSTLVLLKIGKKQHQVLVRETQRQVIRRGLEHVDFLKVAMDVAIRAEVPIEFVGEAPAVRDLGGVLVTELVEIEIESLPTDLPDRITVDLELLAEITDTIKVGDLSFGEGVEVITSPDDVITRVIYQVEEEIVEEELEEEVIPTEEEPEVIERGKLEEEEGEDAE